MYTKTKISIRFIALALLGVLGFVPALALAQDQTAAARMGITSTTTRPNAGVKLAAREAAAKEKAGKEIDRRITSLTKLTTRVSEMDRVDATFKQTLQGNVQNQTQLLAALKAKIDADTSSTSLREDVKSITDSYRIYLLVIPQAAVSAMADRIVNITMMMQGLGLKYQALVQTAAGQGVDTSAATAKFTDLAAKLTDAQAKAQAAVSGILPLQPDNGDKTIAASNAAALKAARESLKAGRDDIAAARKDLAAIWKVIESAKTAAPQTATTTTQ